VTFRPGSDFNLSVTGTIQCTEGSEYEVGVAAAVGLHNPKHGEYELKDENRNKAWAAARTLVRGDCETTGPQSFTAELGLPLEKNDKVWVGAGCRVCSSPFSCDESEATERFKVR
jgi:hypothetical protein